MAKPVQPLTLESLHRLFRRALFAGSLIGVGFLVGIVLFLNATNRAVDGVIEQRTEARRVTCEKDHRFAEGHNNLILYFANLPPSPNDSRTPEQRAALIEDFKAKNLVPVPDCSPEGITDFYEGRK